MPTLLPRPQVSSTCAALDAKYGQDGYAIAKVLVEVASGCRSFKNRKVLQEATTLLEQARKKQLGTLAVLAVAKADRLAREAP